MVTQRLQLSLSERPGRLLRFDGPVKQAAVAVLISPTQEIFFIRRAERRGDPWSGHMAFPGGRKESQDRDLLDTAMRETREEVGVDLQGEGVRVLGRLDDLASPPRLIRPRLVITPWVFALPEHPPVTPNEEVAGTYWFHLERFLGDEGRSTMNVPFREAPLRLPVVRLEDADIWGLTLNILDGLMERLGRR